MLKKVKILGVGVTQETKKNVLEFIVDSLSTTHKKLFIITPNPEILVYAKKHLVYKDKLNSADVSLPDGIGLLLAGQLMGTPFQERIPGVDFIEDLCLFSKEKPLSMGFLGGGPGVARAASECLKLKYPWIKVRWVGEEWENKKDDVVRSSHGMGKKNAYLSEKEPLDILFVAFGFPKQEEWIYENLPHLPVKAAMGVGGSFDYLSGKVVRAPKFVRALGLEWLFRLFRQPWRLKRQLALFEFLELLLGEVIVTKKQKNK